MTEFTKLRTSVTIAWRDDGSAVLSLHYVFSRFDIELTPEQLRGLRAMLETPRLKGAELRDILCGIGELR